MRNLRLLPCLLYMRKHCLPSTVLVRNHVYMGNLTSKIVTPHSMLSSRNCMSSTNKWTGENSVKVSRAFQRLKYVRRVKSAVRVGTAYPEQNPQLASLIEEIRRHDLNIPIEKVTEIALNPKSRTGIYEVAGPRGILFVLQYETSDVSHAAHLVKEICCKHDLSFLEIQAQKFVFYDQRGILMATTQDGMSLEEATEVATKAGAEFVASKLDSNEKTSLEIYCNPSSLHQMKRKLGNFIIDEAFVGYIPKYLIAVPDSVKLKMADAIADFSEVPEIEMIYENIK